eukprot:CAMPEP_0168485058 /NCGR_PEP_ID=MMETSP0228-20121227/66416_1 /TAXON_ID=133427 /ORGANISM="Protoceratium reticulatum, Strain CCCM 535 (=CCMP 1889)" /LENGTH=64 /DNA_ID=CAMNT_0008501615 /DNA_START=1 /DNA_END=193 /DNA_ORIENTATION=+
MAAVPAMPFATAMAAVPGMPFYYGGYPPTMAMPAQPQVPARTVTVQHQAAAPAPVPIDQSDLKS